MFICMCVFEVTRYNLALSADCIGILIAYQHTHVRFISFLSFSLTKLLALSQSHSLYIAVLTCEPVRAPVLAATCRLAGRAAGRHCKHFIYKVH